MLPRAAVSTFLEAGASAVEVSVEALPLLLALRCACLLLGGSSTKLACSFSSFLSPKPGTRLLRSSQLAKGPFAVASSATRWGELGTQGTR